MKGYTLALIIFIVLLIICACSVSYKKEGYYDPVSGARIMSVPGYNPLLYARTYDNGF